MHHTARNAFAIMAGLGFLLWNYGSAAGQSAQQAAGRLEVQHPAGNMNAAVAGGNPQIGNVHETAGPDTPNLEDQAERARRAAYVMQQFAAGGTGVPRRLLDEAYGIAVIPGVSRSTFATGSEWGKGLLTAQQNGQWLAPVYIDAEGGNHGLQIGAETADLVLVFMKEQSLRSLANLELRLGTDVPVVAGPIGEAARNDLSFATVVYSYSHTGDVFEGIALEDVLITLDDYANEEVYGPGLKGRRILEGKLPAPVPAATMPFLAAVQRHISPLANSQ
jgi:lipid-binding SYLF domain-containing protein